MLVESRMRGKAHVRFGGLQARDRPCRPASSATGSDSNARSQIAIRSIGLRHTLDSSIRSQRVTARKTRAHWLGEIARAVIERLERIVGEVQNMTCGQVATVRSGGEHQAASTGASAPARTGGGYAALGTLAVALYTFGLGQDRLTD